MGAGEGKAAIFWGLALSGGEQPPPQEQGRVPGQGHCSAASPCLSPCPFGEPLAPKNALGSGRRSRAVLCCSLFVSPNLSRSRKRSEVTTGEDIPVSQR